MDFRFTTDSASWTTAVEGFFSKLARQRLKNAVFDSLDERLAAIYGFIGHTDENGARPFRWSRKPEELVASWRRGYHMIATDR